MSNFLDNDRYGGYALAEIDSSKPIEYMMEMLKKYINGEKDSKYAVIVGTVRLVDKPKCSRCGQHYE